MKTLRLNSEFAKRYIGVAVLFFGLSLWFLYDAVIVYPNTPVKEGEHRTTVEFQYSAAGLLALASLAIASRVWLNWKRVISWDDEKMWGGAIGAEPVKFSDIVGVDDSQWKTKGIIKFLAKDGRGVKLDSWPQAGVEELVERILSDKSENA